MRSFAIVCVLALAASGPGCGDDRFDEVPADGGDGDGGDGGGGPDAAPRADAEPGAQWSGRAPLPGGIARQETAVVVVGTDIYVLGGFTGSLQVVSEVWIYDTIADAWSEGPSLPIEMHHANAAVVDGEIYVLGFLTTLGFDQQSNVYSLLPGGDWVEEQPMPLNEARGASAVGAVGTDIYIAGGSADNSVTIASRYDTIGQQWQTLAPLPEALDHVVGGVVGDAFYVIGGRTNGLTAVKSAVYEYDPVGNAWLDREPMPTPRGGSAAGVAGGLIIVVGGEGNLVAGSDGVFPQTEAYDPSGDTWTSFQDMRTPRHGTGAAGIGNKLYVPVGATEQAFAAVGINEVFVVP